MPVWRWTATIASAAADQAAAVEQAVALPDAPAAAAGQAGGVPPGVHAAAADQAGGVSLSVQASPADNAGVLPVEPAAAAPTCPPDSLQPAVGGTGHPPPPPHNSVQPAGPASCTWRGGAEHPPVAAAETKFVLNITHLPSPTSSVADLDPVFSSPDPYLESYLRNWEQI